MMSYSAHPGREPVDTCLAGSRNVTFERGDLVGHLEEPLHCPLFVRTQPGEAFVPEYHAEGFRPATQLLTETSNILDSLPFLLTVGGFNLVNVDEPGLVASEVEPPLSAHPQVLS